MSQQIKIKMNEEIKYNQFEILVRTLWQFGPCLVTRSVEQRNLGSNF